MLPRLQAEEQIAAVRIGSMGAGIYPEAEHDKLMRALERRAAGDVPRVRKARPMDLAAMGIGVVSAPPEKGVSDV